MLAGSLHEWGRQYIKIEHSDNACPVSGRPSRQYREAILGRLLRPLSGRDFVKIPATSVFYEEKGAGQFSMF